MLTHKKDALNKVTILWVICFVHPSKFAGTDSSHLPNEARYNCFLLNEEFIPLNNILPLIAGSFFLDNGREESGYTCNMPGSRNKRNMEVKRGLSDRNR